MRLICEASLIATALGLLCTVSYMLIESLGNAVNTQVLGLVSAILAQYSSLAAFVTIVTALASSFTSWSEFSDKASKIDRYSSAVFSLPSPIPSPSPNPNPNPNPPHPCAEPSRCV